MNVVPSIALGRLDAARAVRLADLADWGRAELRLAPWRGIVLANLRRDRLAAVEDALEDLGLAPNAGDGFAGIAACAGRAGCASALADVRGDAASLARRLAGTMMPVGWSVNLAGCGKRCGLRGGATAVRVATQAGYDVRVNRELVRSAIAPPAALDLVVDAHASRLEATRG